MEQLPPEVCNVIIKEIAQPDTYETRATLVALRQVNKSLSTLVTPFVFQTIPLWIGVRSLQNLDAISDHAVLSKYVNAIEFSPLQIKSTEDTASSQGALKRQFDYIFKTINASELALAQYSCVEARFLKEQSRLHEDDRALRIMIRALRDLPNLQSFHIITRSRRVGIWELTRAFNTLSNLTVDFTCKSVLLMAVRALQLAQKEIKSFKVYTTYPTEQLVDGQAAPKELSLLGLERLTAETFSTALSALNFRFLECLQHLSIGLPDTEPDDNLEPFINAMEYVLKKSVNLISLEVLGTVAHWEDYDVIDPLRTAKLPKLRDLSLETLLFEDDEIILALFSVHCKVLQRVNLYYVRIEAWWGDYDIWVEVFRRLRELEWTKLKTFKVMHSMNQRCEVDIAPYLRRETNVMPLEREDVESGSE